MSKEKILIFGASDHTRYTLDIIEQEGAYEVTGIVDTTLEKGQSYAGLPILGSDAELKEIAKEQGIKKGIVAIGDNFIRKKVTTSILASIPEFEFVSAVHPSVILGKHVSIGKGSVLMAGVIVNNDSRIGAHCFLATKASLDHDSQMGDYASLSPGVTTGGNVTIGAVTAIGIGANILHGMTIGAHTVIGSGALVLEPIPPKCIAFGVPARVIRKREEGEPYL
jgi:sugar O-acyltransferase (sialic acid O-acetyltransferase NeuD family)